MCCQNGKTARAVHDAITCIDPEAGAPAEFWHERVVGNGSTAPASSEDSVAAIRAAWDAAKRNNKDWQEKSARERIEANNAFAALIKDVESGDVVLTENQVQKVASYAASRKEPGRVTRKVGTIAAAAVVAFTGLFAAAQPAAAATGDAAIAFLDKSNASAPHVADRGGICPPGYRIGMATETHNATFVKWNSKQFKKKNKANRVIKAGDRDCIVDPYKKQTSTTPTPNASPSPASTSTGGKLPANFPKNPTAQDIQALGWTKDTVVDPNLRIPRPTGAPLVKAELPDSVDMVSIDGRTTESVDRGDGTIDTNEYLQTTWVIRGGQGVMNIGGEYVKLPGPGKEIYIKQSAIPAPQITMRGSTYDDYGQANLPYSATRDWNIPREMGNHNGGSPVSKRGNASRLGESDNRVYYNEADGTFRNITSLS